MSHYPPVSPFYAGIGGKCPRCGQGALFKSYIGPNARCPACGLHYAEADAGDGPALFIMFIVGFTAVAVAFIARFVCLAATLTAFLISGGLAIGLTLALLRPMRGVTAALKSRRKAEEGRIGS